MSAPNDDRDSSILQNSRPNEEKTTDFATLREEFASCRSAIRGYIRTLHKAHKSTSRRQRERLGRLRLQLTRKEARRKSRFHRWFKKIASDRQKATRRQRALLSQVRFQLSMSEAARRAEFSAWLEALTSDGTAKHQEHRSRCASRTLDSCVQAFARSPLSEENRPLPSLEDHFENDDASAAGASKNAPEDSPMRGQVFRYLANHPDGTDLAEIKRELALEGPEAQQIVEKLVEDGKVESRERLYFAT